LWQRGVARIKLRIHRSVSDLRHELAAQSMSFTDVVID
jgi:hypothetical protein